MMKYKRNDKSISGKSLKFRTKEYQSTSKQYKDLLFRKLFLDKKRAIELCNAIVGTDYPEDTEVDFWEANELVARYNDLAFTIGGHSFVMVEAQSTNSVNLPLRCLFYLSNILQEHVMKTGSLHQKELIRFPVPRFYMLYSGNEKIRTDTLRLSDSFMIRQDDIRLELLVKVENIRYDGGSPLLGKSQSLLGYSTLIDQIEKNLRSGMQRDKAILRAMDYCIKNDILKDYLSQKYLEVLKVLNMQYDAEAELRVVRAEGIAEGEAKGKAEGIAEGEAKGKAEGIAEGEARGKAEEKEEIALILLKENHDHAFIMRITGISTERLAELQKKI
jgi:hypothetical protein